MITYQIITKFSEIISQKLQFILISIFAHPRHILSKGGVYYDVEIWGNIDSMWV